MEIFEGDDSAKEDGSFLCNGEFGLNCGVASEIPWLCVCIDSRYAAGDAAGGEFVESNDIFILGSLILSLFKRKKSLSLLGLLSNVPFFNNLSTLSCRRSLVMSLKKKGFYNFFMYCINFCAFAVVPNFSYCVICFAVKLFQYFIWHYCVTHDNDNSKIQIPRNTFNWDGKTVNWDGLREIFTKLIRLISKNGCQI